jgi:chaperone BCS1
VGHTPVLARKTKDKEGAASLGLAPRESVTLTALGRGHGVFLRLKAEVDDHARGRKGIRAHVWKASGWQSIGRVGTRDPASLALPAATLARLMGHVDSFLSDRGWRADRGMPWRTGVLLSGPPGTGKSSLARALCSRLCKDMYVVDLSAMNDQTLRDAMDSVPEGCVVVMEDLDAAGLGRETAAGDKPETRLTLSGVLNAVDGAASGEGRILLATTNRPESLDSALVRDGRFDLRLELGLLETGPMREYLARVYPGLEGLDEWEARPGVAPCTLQRLCLEHKSEPLKVLEQVATRTGETG